MKTPITCSANDLASICADLEKRGFVPWAVDAMVKTNAGYKVRYFQAAPEREARDAGDDLRTPKAGSNPAAAANFPHQGETPDTLVAPMAVKEATASLSSIKGSRIPDEQPAFGGPNEVGVDSIETRLAALKSKLVASGKLRRTRAARLPYRDS